MKCNASVSSELRKRVMFLTVGLLMTGFVFYVGQVRAESDTNLDAIQIDEVSYDKDEDKLHIRFNDAFKEYRKSRDDDFYMNFGKTGDNRICYWLVKDNTGEHFVFGNVSSRCEDFLKGEEYDLYFLNYNIEKMSSNAAFKRLKVSLNRKLIYWK